MKTRILVNGAAGKMGVIACEALENHPDFELVARCNRQDNLTFAINDTQAQAVIDLTEPASVLANTMAILEAKARPIIGTTGLTESQISDLSSQCDIQKIGCIIAPNFSIGALLLMHCAQQIARLMPECEIIESHHPQKKDAPSGTSLKTAALICEARQGVASSARAGNPLALGYTDAQVPIHSIRLPGILADETVIFGNTGETLSIAHQTLSRDAFKPGILLACGHIMTLNRLVYGLEGLLFG